MGTEALALRGVNTLYGESHVLHDLSFTLHAGRVLALLGRNGVGKTTCINSIMGLVPPRDGDIELFGEPIARLPTERIVSMGIGLVPQGRRIFPTLTVRENLVVAARKGAGNGREAWTVRRVFDTFPRLRDRANGLAANLSGGEQQMLAIGRALMTNPKVLLLDEPSEGLAPQIVHELQQILLNLKREGLSIILIEQNTGMAFAVADDVVVLNTARVTFDGPVEEIRQRPDFLNEQLGVY